MEIIFSPKAQEDLKYWKNTGNKAIQQKNRKTVNVYTTKPLQRYRQTRAFKIQFIWCLV